MFDVPGKQGLFVIFLNRRKFEEQVEQNKLTIVIQFRKCSCILATVHKGTALRGVLFGPRSKDRGYEKFSYNRILV